MNEMNQRSNDQTKIDALIVTNWNSQLDTIFITFINQSSTNQLLEWFSPGDEIGLARQFYDRSEATVDLDAHQTLRRLTSG